MIIYTLIKKPVKKLKRLQYEGGLNYQQVLPIPDLLIIEEDKKETGGYFLNRFTNEGNFGGDTWHQKLEDAKYQATIEYGKSIVGWEEIPENIKNPLEHILEKYKKN